MPKPLPLPDERSRRPHDCGPSAWRTVYRYHHGRNSRIVDLSNPVNGTDPATLEAIIRRDANWHVVSGSAFIDDLRHYCESWRPPICLMTFPGDEDSHYVCVGGVWRNRVYYQCSTEGWCAMPVGEFEAAWHAVGRYAQFERWMLAAWPR